jgi:hypothetical protein
MVDHRVLSKEEEQVLQVVRTETGVCARCGQGVVDHGPSDGSCADKKGSYTWSYTREGMKDLMGGLEAMVEAGRSSQALRDSMDPDAVMVLDYIAEIQLGGGRSPSRKEIADHLRWEPGRVSAALDKLVRDGLIAKDPGR